MPTPAETARAYHAITKHHVRRQARSLGYIDWDTQPDPFRRYAGAALVELELGAAREVTGSVARLLQLSLGLTAWKQYEGNRWALRANPSSGNLHPTEGYVVLPAGRGGLPAGVLHYAPREHALELRCSLDRDAARALGEVLPAGGFLVGLTSILWREAWKYGERALRYCALDTGHAIGALDYAAACVGMRTVALNDWTDAQLAQLFGTSRAADFAALDPWDHEQPELLVAVVPEASDWQAIEPESAAWHSTTSIAQPERLLEIIQRGTWHGKPNALSQEHHEWDVIHATAKATQRIDASQTSVSPNTLPPHTLDVARLPALIQQRRSAVSMQPGAELSLAAFGQLLDATLKRSDTAPWRGFGEASRAHLLLFVHRVEGLPRGVYFLERSASKDDSTEALHAELQAAMSGPLDWQRCDELAAHGFAHLRLFRLRSGSCEAIARAVSCQQDIAADGAFSLGMLTRLGSVVKADASAYRRLFWECGLIGQALYIEAEAAGQNATGIGCFFDDSVHDLLGLRGDEWQILYHFTIGQATHDDRLQTLPPYAHLKRNGAG